MADGVPARPLNLQVVIPLLLALTVLEFLQTIDDRLASDVLATINSRQLGGADDFVIVWTHKLAVRVQMALVEAGHELAEPVGRCIDDVLSASADGHRFKFWSSPPLPGLSALARLSGNDPPRSADALPVDSCVQPERRSVRISTTVEYQPKPCAKGRGSGSNGRVLASKKGPPISLASTVCAALVCAVTLDFSRLGAAAPILNWEGVPINETAQGLSLATSSLLSLAPHELGLLRDDDSVVSPRMPLSSLIVNGTVHLKVVPHIRVGGDSPPPISGAAADLPDGPLAGFAFTSPPMAAQVPMEVAVPAVVPAPAPTITPMHIDTPTPEPDMFVPDVAPPLHPAHPGRRMLPVQPAPSYYPSQRVDQRWQAYAEWEELRTGKAARKDQWYSRKSRDRIKAATKEELLQRRAEFLRDQLHPEPRGAKTGKRFAPTEERTPGERKRAATPDSFAEPRHGLQGPSSSEARPGPGRGHRYEPARSLREQIEETLPPADQLAKANWLQKIALKKEWQTARMEELEEQVRRLTFKYVMGHFPNTWCVTTAGEDASHKERAPRAHRRGPAPTRTRPGGAIAHSGRGDCVVRSIESYPEGGIACSTTRGGPGVGVDPRARLHGRAKARSHLSTSRQA